MKSILEPIPTVKPKVFIGATSEGLKIARGLKDCLAEVAEIHLWTDDDIFELSQSTLESLIRALGDSDFAVLVMTADDITVSRNAETPSVRDNIIFEAGLFMGKLGHDRVFLLSPYQADLKIPSDLHGITMARFVEQSDSKSVIATLGKSCSQIKRSIKGHPAYGERSKLVQLRSLFGALTEKAALVCSNLHVNEAVLDSVNRDATLPPGLKNKLKDYPLAKSGSNLFFSATDVVGESELRATAHLARLFSQYIAGSPLEVLTDEKVADEDDLSFVSFGSYNNIKSVDFFNDKANTLVDTRLFNKVDRRFVSKKTGRPLHDAPDDEHDYGIIAKIYPHQFPGRTWIICGGLGEWGTSGSAYFLATHWSELMVKLSKHPESQFVALIRVKKRKDKSASLEWLHTKAQHLPSLFVVPAAASTPYD